MNNLFKDSNSEKIILITGCEGFIGSYLAELLVEKGFNVHGIVYGDIKNIAHICDKLFIHNCSITDKNILQAIIQEVRPNYVFHLAAQSLLSTSWQNIENTFNINVLGTIYLLDCIRKAHLEPVIEITCSGDEYGYNGSNDTLIKESSELHPSSPYGVSKLAIDMLSHIYWQNCGMKIIRIRPFQIVGPRKVSDACSDFARGIAEVIVGKKTKLFVGNLDSVRDFLDVKDAVKAMWLLAEKGTLGQVYNICSGKGYRIKDILDKLIALSAHPIEVLSEHSRMRPSEKPYLVGDNSKLRELGWTPQISIEDTLTDILHYWKLNV